MEEVLLGVRHPDTYARCNGALEALRITQSRESASVASRVGYLDMSSRNCAICDSAMPRSVSSDSAVNAEAPIVCCTAELAPLMSV